MVDRRGIGRYARALLRRFADANDRAELVLLVPQLFPALARSALADQISSEHFKIARRSAAAHLQLDVVWYPWNGMTWVAPTRKVATVHDVWPLASPAPDPRTRRNEQIPFRTTAASAERIVADSQFTKSEIVIHLGVGPERIDVVHLGVEPPVDSSPKDRALPEDVGRYVLFVGEAEPRKDLPTLVAAMEALPEALRRETALVVAGRRAQWRNFGQLGSVRALLVGEITESRLAALYRGAAAFVFPSLYEGFGLPILEAMSYGAPVIASNAASIPEAGADAALYFRAGNRDSLAGQLAHVLTDSSLAQRLSAAGRARAASMTWDKCADETLKVFEKAALP